MSQDRQDWQGWSTAPGGPGAGAPDPGPVWAGGPAPPGPRERRPVAGPVAAMVGGGVALLASFLPWYWVDFGFTEITRNGWQEPAAGASIVATILAVAGGVLGGVTLATRSSSAAAGRGLGVGQAALGAGAVVLVAAKLASNAEYSSIGFVLAFAGALAVVVGGIVGLVRGSRAVGAGSFVPLPGAPGAPPWAGWTPPPPGPGSPTGWGTAGVRPARPGNAATRVGSPIAARRPGRLG